LSISWDFAEIISNKLGLMKGKTPKKNFFEEVNYLDCWPSSPLLCSPFSVWWGLLVPLSRNMRERERERDRERERVRARKKERERERE